MVCSSLRELEELVAISLLLDIGTSMLDSGTAMLDDSGSVADEDVASSEDRTGKSMLEEDAADESSAGPELLGSSEHAKKTALAAVRIIRDAAILSNIL